VVTLLIVPENGTLVPDCRVMMSRDLTSSFNFWSCDHLHMDIVYLLTKFGAYIFVILSKVTVNNVSLTTSSAVAKRLHDVPSH